MYDTSDDSYFDIAEELRAENKRLRELLAWVDNAAGDNHNYTTPERQLEVIRWVLKDEWKEIKG